ncbi:hypothetical protein TNCV_29991 [Trichonephila clavipes]|nr:hypothetical protein TNCV_29991 [Trichonephila clavipes]
MSSQISNQRIQVRPKGALARPTSSDDISHMTESIHGGRLPSDPSFIQGRVGNHMDASRNHFGTGTASRTRTKADFSRKSLKTAEKAINNSHLRKPSQYYFGCRREKEVACG